MVQLPVPLFSPQTTPHDPEPDPPARRFWNQGLKPLYDACPLPVQSAPSALHHRAESSYGFRFTFQDWHQNWTHVPPGGHPIGPSLAARLRPLIYPPPPEPKAPPRKKAKAAATDSPSTSTSTADDVDAAPKKPPPFKRKVAVEGHLRTYKIRMIPTREQERELFRALAGARRAFNWALEQVKEHGQRPNTIALRTAFRGQYEPFRSTLTGSHKGKQPISNRILAGGIKQLADAYASNKAKQDKDPSHHYEIKYRGRRNYTDTIKIEKDPVSGNKNSPLLKFAPVPYANSDRRAECLAFFGCNFKGKGGIRLQDKQHVIARLLAEGDRLKEDAKIQHDKRTGAFYFIYTFDTPKLVDPDPDFTSKRIASLDSGVDPFNAYYSPTTGEYGRLLARFREQLEPRILKLDALQSKIDKRHVWTHDPEGKITDKQLAPPPPNRTRTQWRRTTHRLEKCLARERRRHVGWTQMAHYNAANFLLSKFDLIINPKLPTQKLSMRSGRKLRTKTARAMLTMSHYMFDQRLQWASTRYRRRRFRQHALYAAEPAASHRARVRHRPPRVVSSVLLEVAEFALGVSFGGVGAGVDDDVGELATPITTAAVTAVVGDLAVSPAHPDGTDERTLLQAIERAPAVDDDAWVDCTTVGEFFHKLRGTDGPKNGKQAAFRRARAGLAARGLIQVRHVAGATPRSTGAMHVKLLGGEPSEGTP